MRYRIQAVSCLSICVAAVPFSAVGQNLAIGVRGGLNLSDVSSPEFGVGGVGNRTAFVGGGFLTFSGTGRFSFQPEVLYSQRGFSRLVQGGTMNAALDYIEIPLLVKARLGSDSRRLRPSVYGGWFFAFEASCRLSGPLDSIGTSPECEALIPGGFLGSRGKLDSGVVLGLGLDYGIAGKLFAVLDGRYGIGVSTIQWELEEDRVSSRIWSFSAGVGLLIS